MNFLASKTFLALWSFQTSALKAFWHKSYLNIYLTDKSPLGFLKENMAQRQNYAVKMDALKQKKIAAGLVSDLYPEVSSMVIQMTYFRKGSNPVLMLRTVNVFPTGYAYFNMDCMINGCAGGGFDLSPV